MAYRFFAFPERARVDEINVSIGANSGCRARCWAPLVALWLLASACSPNRIVGAEVCGNGIDDDDDDLLDCSDPECEHSAVCDARGHGDPDVPDWVQVGDYDAPDLGVIVEDCSALPEGGPAHRPGLEEPLAPLDDHMFSVDCELLPDSCGFGLRCIPLTVSGRVVEAGCVRQGCAPSHAACAQEGLSDACQRGHLCLDIPSVCGEHPCCVPMCGLDDPACQRCIPMTAIYSGAFEPLLEIGICADPPP